MQSFVRKYEGVGNNPSTDPALIDRGNLIDGDWVNYSVRPTNMVAEQVTTTDQLVEKTVEVPKGKDAYKVAQEKSKKQMKIRIK